ncbi:unnamed protein product [Miscanthus lutarioriparius]|uniref:HAT C-terminal dimerisation domain-containing protein n=1 Tax=Miscanthus lutarioriparius TaxID=422564 RepID=A0A811MJ05_9POAL|nr:unnamed protein product [Miscanthus lutarioriparius]
MAPTEDGVLLPTAGKAKAKTKTVGANFLRHDKDGHRKTHRQLTTSPNTTSSSTTQASVAASVSVIGSSAPIVDIDTSYHRPAPAIGQPNSVVHQPMIHLQLQLISAKMIKMMKSEAHLFRQECNKRYRAEGPCGTTAFKSHLRSKHSIVEGQQQLNVGKNTGSEIAHIVPFKYDQEVSLRKLNLAITMHEYPFNIVEHEYLVDFIKSLRPSFPIKSRVTVRKEIIDRYLEEKETLYAHLKTIKCRFSATMDMWTSCQNKGYMCVTIHWIDDNWRIQKRIIGFFNVKGRHTGAKLSETFSEVMVKWYIEKRLFALTLDNASSNEVAVNDIISDLKENAKKTSSVAAPGPSNTADVLMGNVDHDLEEFLYDESEHAMVETNELERYMGESLLKIVGEFDILAWWKNKREEYPILSQIVRDVMAVQVSTVASESAFSAAGRVVDPYRSRLDPEMVQALICTKDWVAAANAKVVGSIVSDLEVDALTNVVAKLKIEDKDKEGDGDSEEDNEDAKDMESDGNSDPDIMDDADEL